MSALIHKDLVVELVILYNRSQNLGVLDKAKAQQQFAGLLFFVFENLAIQSILKT
jgi:hypothetical protein